MRRFAMLAMAALAAVASTLAGAPPAAAALPGAPATGSPPESPSGSPAGSSARAPGLCVEAARAAARRHGIPPGVMQAITLVETRRRVDGVAGPWPWTLNVEGQGHWFATRAEALGHALREMGRGRRSIDLGCFQLNWRWHGQNFPTPDGMLDPALSADYAARFLAGLHAETGDWMRAVGHYHSRTPTHAERYRGLIGRALARLDPDPGSRFADPGAGAEVAPGPRAHRSEPASTPIPPVREDSVARGGVPVPLIPLGVAAREQAHAGSAQAAGGVALSVFARAAPSWFGGSAGLSGGLR